MNSIEALYNRKEQVLSKSTKMTLKKLSERTVADPSVQGSRGSYHRLQVQEDEKTSSACKFMMMRLQNIPLKVKSRDSAQNKDENTLKTKKGTSFNGQKATERIDLNADAVYNGKAGVYTQSVVAKLHLPSLFKKRRLIAAVSEEQIKPRMSVNSQVEFADHLKTTSWELPNIRSGSKVFTMKREIPALSPGIKQALGSVINEPHSGEILKPHFIESFKRKIVPSVQDLTAGKIVSLNLLSRTRKLGHSTMELSVSN
ncbi:hypothetical protein Tco_0454764 [Tanacetum coccineum]